jgi:hypothetical protein
MRAVVEQLLAVIASDNEDARTHIHQLKNPAHLGVYELHTFTVPAEGIVPRRYCSGENVHTTYLRVMALRTLSRLSDSQM